MRIWPRQNGRFARPRPAARRSSACRSCSARSISAARKTPNCSRWRRRSPGRDDRTLGKLARELGVVIVASLFERRAAGLYHNTAAVIGADGEIAGHLPQDAHPGRSAVFREVLLHAGRPGLPQFRHAVRADRRAGVLGPVVSGGRAAGVAGAARTFCSIPRRSAGTRRKRRSTARRNRTRGKPYSAPTPSPTGSMWPR